MITFCIAIVLLLLGYGFYSRFCARILGVDNQRITPAYSQEDGVDYAPMSTWRLFLIQFLNIAGLGPIFGAIMGAKFGTSSYLWIVFGCIFGGAMHDYFSGMMSVRAGGATLPEIQGRYLGNAVRRIMLVVMCVLMLLVGAVFASGPASIIASLTPGIDVLIWVAVIFAYYFLATLVPIDKLIGRIYPVFGFCLLFMAAGVLFCIFSKHIVLPEIWDGLANIHPEKATQPIFPMMFISIACGAVSGFHASQSPITARCMKKESNGRLIFYGAMIAEGLIALIWAAAATYFYRNTPEGRQFFMQGANAAIVVNFITQTWMGKVGAVLSLLGVVAAPLTSGDTAFRSCRLMAAEALHIGQKTMGKRLLMAVPIFLIGGGILTFSLINKNGFNIIWNYFAWLNQVIAAITLWAITVYLCRQRKPYLFALLPALFMSMVCTTFILISKNQGLGLPHLWSYSIAAGLCLLYAFLFFRWKHGLRA